MAETPVPDPAAAPKLGRVNYSWTMVRKKDTPKPPEPTPEPTPPPAAPTPKGFHVSTFLKVKLDGTESDWLVSFTRGGARGALQEPAAYFNEKTGKLLIGMWNEDANEFEIHYQETIEAEGILRGEEVLRHTTEALAEIWHEDEVSFSEFVGREDLEVVSGNRPTEIYLKTIKPYLDNLKKKEQAMSNEERPSVSQLILQASMHGGQMAVAHKVNDNIVEGVKKLLGRFGVFIDTPLGRAFARSMAPVTALYATEYFPGSIPKEALVRKGSLLAMEATSYEAGKVVVDKLQDTFVSLAQLMIAHKNNEDVDVIDGHVVRQLEDSHVTAIEIEDFEAEVAALSPKLKEKVR